MATSLTIVFLGVLSLLPLASPLPSDAVLDASEILSDSGYVSMSLTLALVSQTLTLKSPATLTVFAPPDSAFRRSGQPSLSLLHYHLCPLPLSLQTLRSLPSGTILPTLSLGRSIVVTSSPSDPEISLNNVTVTIGSTPSPIFTDGSLIVYGTEDLLDPNFRYSRKCRSPATVGVSRFQAASETLRSSGYSATSSFLDSQLVGFGEDPFPAITVFAPPDMAVMVSPASVFFRHIVPCRLLKSDLSSLGNGTVLATFSDGFSITVTRSNSTLMINGVAVLEADAYENDSLAVHRLGDVLPATRSPQTDRRMIEDVMRNENVEF